jgi:hypothetical protein
MKAAQPKTADELRMSSKEFDRIMGQALQVKPEGAAERAKPAAKRKAARKKRRNKE